MSEASTAQRIALLQKRLAEEAQLQKEFFSNFNHELRTPLNAILGFSSLLHADSAISEDAKTDLAIIIDNAQYLLALVEDILNVSTHEFDLLPVQLERFDLHQLIGRLLPLIKLMLQPGVVLESCLNADTQWIHTDPKKLRQILLNLLSNAAKYTPQGNILLQAQQSAPHQLQLSITDTGIGMDAAMQARLFTAFETAAVHGSSTGLGLVLVKKLVDLLQGHLSISSTPNQGTVVVLELRDVLK